MLRGYGFSWVTSFTFYIRKALISLLGSAILSGLSVFVFTHMHKYVFLAFLGNAIYILHKQRL